MPKILGIRIQNFRALKDLKMGRLYTDGSDSALDLTPLSVIIGKNGVGKSSIFDAFGFLSDCLKVGVEEASELKNRGGFNRLRSFGQKGPIAFEIYYRQKPDDRPITFEVAFDQDKNGRLIVEREILRQRRKGEQFGQPYPFLKLSRGSGTAWKGETSVEGVESPDSVTVSLTEKDKLGIVTLGSLKEHPRIAKFREFLENWYLSYFTPDAARGLPINGPHRHLNTRGDNLGNFVQFMEREHKEKIQSVLGNIAKKIPGIDKIETAKTEDNRLLLKFNDKGFSDPFLAQQMSDGTLKLFMYLLLLEDPEPFPFICIEEPENGLYHKLLEILASEFREHTKIKGKKDTPQMLITTHQPYLVDALSPNEVWVLEKGEDGFSKIKRASDDPLVKNMVDEGLPLGGLWYSDYLDAR